MNVICRCYGELFGQHGLTLFDLPVVAEAPKLVAQALQKCHEASVLVDQGAGNVKVWGKKAWQIPGGTMKIVAATCLEQYSGTTVHFESLDSGLPAGLLASPAFMPMVRCTAYIPITKVLLYPCTVVGTLQEVCAVSLLVSQRCHRWWPQWLLSPFPHQYRSR